MGSTAPILLIQIKKLTDQFGEHPFAIHFLIFDL
jgi:hypothetical protein